MKRILFLHSTALYPPSGENIRGNYLLKSLSKAKINVDVVCPYSSHPIKSPNIHYKFIKKVDRFCNHRELSYLLSWISAFRYIALFKYKYDIVYCYNLPATLLAFFMKHRNNILIADLYEADFPELRIPKGKLARPIILLSKLWLLLFLRKTDKIIMLTKQLQYYLKINYNKDSMVVYDAADKNMFRPHNNTNVNKEINFVFHGGIEERDGLIEFLDALALSKINFKFHIIGEGTAKEGIKEAAVRNGFSERVIFHGWVDYNLIPDMLSRFDIGVIVPKNIGLNTKVIPRKLFEYIALGLPSIVIDQPAIREILNKNEAFFCQSNFPEEISKKIKEIDSNKQMILDKSNALRLKKKLYLQDECERIIHLLLK